MNALAHWQDLSERKATFAQAMAGYDESLAREAAAESLEARRVADSLLREQQTGIRHCSCTNPPHPLP